LQQIEEQLIYVWYYNKRLKYINLYALRMYVYTTTRVFIAELFVSVLLNCSL